MDFSLKIVDRIHKRNVAFKLSNILVTNAFKLLILCCIIFSGEISMESRSASHFPRPYDMLFILLLLVIF